jgi:hypothetical protein
MKCQIRETPLVCLNLSHYYIGLPADINNKDQKGVKSPAYLPGKLFIQNLQVSLYAAKCR